MRTIALSTTLLLTVLLAACTTETHAPPSIAFMGTAAGTLQTPVEELTFSNRFTVDEESIVTVVAFSHIVDGTELRAQWFTPDERNRPIGMQRMTSASGADVARFIITAQNGWEPAPYKVIAYATYDHDANPDTPPLHGSGSLQFYVGLNDEEIRTYQQDYAEWLRRRTEQRNALKAKEEKEELALLKAQEHLRAPEAIIGNSLDVDGDGVRELIVLDTRGLPAIMPGSLQNTVQQFAIVSQENGILLSSTEMNDLESPFSITILPTGTVLITSQEGSGRCEREYRWDTEGGEYVVGVKRCT